MSLGVSKTRDLYPTVITPVKEYLCILCSPLAPEGSPVLSHGVPDETVFAAVEVKVDCVVVEVVVGTGVTVIVVGGGDVTVVVVEVVALVVVVGRGSTELGSTKHDASFTENSKNVTIAVKCSYLYHPNSSRKTQVYLSIAM